MHHITGTVVSIIIMSFALTKGISGVIFHIEKLFSTFQEALEKAVMVLESLLYILPYLHSKANSQEGFFKIIGSQE